MAASLFASQLIVLTASQEQCQRLPRYAVGEFLIARHRRGTAHRMCHSGQRHSVRHRT